MENKISMEKKKQYDNIIERNNTTSSLQAEALDSGLGFMAIAGITILGFFVGGIIARCAIKSDSGTSFLDHMPEEIAGPIAGGALVGGAVCGRLFVEGAQIGTNTVKRVHREGFKSLLISAIPNEMSLIPRNNKEISY